MSNATDAEPDVAERIRRAVERDDLEAATEYALQAYGDEIYNYIRKLAGKQVLADDAFQEFSVDLWEGWETFDWESSLETWVYTIARNAAYDVMRHKERDPERPFRTDEQQQLVASWTRTVTKNFEKTEAKQWLWDLVQELDPEKRELLVLRIGHQKPWKEVARVMEDEDLEETELRRASNRLRKKYQRLKKTLKKRSDEFPG